jgi:hypothetical protein
MENPIVLHDMLMTSCNHFADERAFSKYNVDDDDDGIAALVESLNLHAQRKRKKKISVILTVLLRKSGI